MQNISLRVNVLRLRILHRVADRGGRSITDLTPAAEPALPETVSTVKVTCRENRRPAVSFFGPRCPVWETPEVTLDVQRRQLQRACQDGKHQLAVIRLGHRHLQRRQRVDFFYRRYQEGTLHFGKVGTL